MDAGRELDALVAEKVMGWEHECQLVIGEYHGIKNVYHLSPERAAYRRRSEHDHYWERWSPNGDEVVVNDEVPYYSTDIAAAWEVVKKMGEFGFSPDGNDQCYDFIMALYKVLNIKQSWEVDYQEIYTLMTASPEAICLAALKAKGVKV